MRISVIGTGYLGAVHAACMAAIGHDVIGVDIDAERIARLAAGHAPFFEPGLGEILSRTVADGKLRFATSLAQAAAFADIHFICVGTPQLPGSHAADLSGIDTVIAGLAPHLDRDCLVVGKSTVPVGTAARLADTLAALAPAGTGARLAWNPEFLREGLAVQDTLRPDRIVVGITGEADDAILRSVYAPMIDAGIPYLVTELATAELVKVAANAFLATKISFINAIADLCEAAGADVVTLADAMSYDARIGRGALSAGLGFGGGCLPKDLRALLARANELGVAGQLSFLHQIDEINTGRRARTVELVRELVGGTLRGQHVAVLGAAFKPGSDDVRDSPALAVAAAIHAAGAVVRVHDPVAIDNARKVHPALDYTSEPQEACEGADMVIHATDWRQYRLLDPVRLRPAVRAARVLDCRNTLPLSRWRAAGWAVWGIGRKP